jgi:membrane-bound lytic murein transglycosylase F
MIDEFTNKYDHLFQRFAAEFFSGLDIDWRWFRAQGIAESGLNPMAVSSAGATGIMQLMPGTYAEMTKLLGMSASKTTAALLYDPETNVRCGIAYDRQMWNIWKQEQGAERIWFMLASYNAGPGNIVKAQRMAAVQNRWASVSMQLHLVTGPKHSQETIGYVRRIRKIYGWDQP